ncbi:MAG TPA: M50 family metallopeptidase [Solirubrobacterales bacterium]|nr:M50 family metallopeptidase [Solirubrobacterales bacterium]
MNWSWFLAFAGFAALIVFHELGHFTAAKAVGMRAERFSLFFPPYLARKRVGETEYCVGLIPLGGFVKITGMNPEEELPPDIAPRGYYHQPVWKRIVVIAAGPAVNLVIAFLILFVLAFDFAEGAPRVAEISKGSAAAESLQLGDRIISADGVRSDDTAVLARQISSHRCEGRARPGCRAETPVVLVVERDGRPVTVRVRPRFDSDPDVRRTVVGFQWERRPLNPSVPEAARLSLDLMWDVTSGTVETIAQIFNPDRRDEISGVVGSYETTRQAFEFDLRRAFAVLGLISLSLAVINLFPFLPLDGGHIFWSIVEKVRGRPVPYRIMEQSGILGFVLVLFLAFVGLTNDIDRLQNDGFRQP